MTEKDKSVLAWTAFATVLCLFLVAGAWHVIKDHEQRLRKLEGVSPVTSEERP